MTVYRVNQKGNSLTSLAIQVGEGYYELIKRAKIWCIENDERLSTNSRQNLHQVSDEIHELRGEDALTRVLHGFVGLLGLVSVLTFILVLLAVFFPFLAYTVKEDLSRVELDEY